MPGTPTSRPRSGTLAGHCEVTATLTLVLVDLEERRAVPIPEAYREPVRAFEGDDLQE